ncbi:MAG: UDP-N-acetylglucosamine--N-acetylmuramyl-(pentapeptide) pyrophosphoryl-undecaprenol N-acetylglucosamine transferase [Bacillota bacterium]|nr:UDP-N-acetylglucosamine--N-acetylmuramyl-(pentapeptide) pyrophosphoryl-undecaprenol N-acetylglucosamine transferase [Bacillota bacterium]
MSASAPEALVLFTGGGTSGHITPALAIAEELCARVPGVRVEFVGSADGLEADIVPRAGYVFHPVNARPFRRRLSKELLLAVRDLFVGRRQCLGLLDRLRPAAVVATGGYVSAPLLAAAARRGVPFLIHEQNALPGRANLMMAPKAGAICLGYEAARSHFPAAAPVTVTGNPVPALYRELTREAARRRLGFGPEERIVLVTGGSLGARTLNRIALDWLETDSAAADLRLILVSGRLLAAETRERAQRIADPRLELHDFLYDMPWYQAAADLIVCRAGALTCAEIAALGRVALFIPYPYATGDHQAHNARVAETAGAAFFVRDAEASAARFEEVLRRLEEPGVKEKMEANSRSLAQPEARREICDRLLEIWQRAPDAGAGAE